MLKKAKSVILLLLCVATAWLGQARPPVDRLSRRGASGRIAVRAGGKHLPSNAEVTFRRTREERAKRRLAEGWERRRVGRDGPKKRLLAKAGVAAPKVLAMYDIAISADGSKWQPAAGEPVRVDVELDEPVAVTAASALGVVHLSDDGEVEVLDSSRYGFTYNKDKSAVTAFWFSATGFSIYSIVDNSGKTVTVRRFYHFYDHPSDIENSDAVAALPYRYTDQSNDVVNVQIVKDGDALKEPPIPQDVMDEEGNLVSMFEGWYVVHSAQRPAGTAESKLDSMTEPFEFVWPEGVTGNRLAFTNAVSVTESVDWDYYVVPLFEHARYLQFNENEISEQDAAAHIVDRKIIAINDETGIAHIKVSDVTAALKNSRNEYFSGWTYQTGDNTYSNLIMYSAAGLPQDAYIDVTRDLFNVTGGDTINLYPVYVSAHFLNFDTNAKGTGATYVGSRFVRSTSAISEVEPSGNRKGYDFDGWCIGTVVSGGKVELGTQVTDSQGRFYANLSVTDAGGVVILTTDASGTVRLNRDVTLFGSWTANTSASYRVVVWQQRVTDAKDAAESAKTYYYVTHYTSPAVSATTQISESLVTSFSGTEPGGASVTRENLTTLSGPASENITDTTFEGFHYARFACDDATVAPDGSTVINLYYDRDLITFRFCFYRNGQSQTIYTATTGTGSDLYGTEDGENYFSVYYNSSDGKWYKSREEVASYSYSYEHTGDRYVKNGNSYTRTTGNSGTQYRKSGGSYYLIYYNEEDGKWYRNRTETTDYAYSGLYAGTRYSRSTSSWIVDDSLTMTGLYGQTLASNGYTWPSDRKWMDEYSGSSGSGSQTTFLDAFLPTTGGDSTFYSSETLSDTGATIIFYKEALDGSWVEANRVRTGSSNGFSFNISDKYNGFTAYQYGKGSSWSGVGAYNSSTRYYGSAVSVSSSETLHIRFKRNAYELIFRDGDAPLLKSGEEISVLFEGSLSAYNLPYTDTRLDWGDRNLEEGTFDGWYEDASLTVKFDFSATMPSGTKTLYAKWSPVKYKVTIDPNGGELQVGDSTWFYLDHGEKIVEYAITRNYKLDMHNGTFYYSYHPWNPLGDKHVTPTDSADFIPNISRRAYYTENQEEATDSVNRYSYEPGAYSFMGWYEVLENGKLASDPFNFAEAPNRPVDIRAVWRRTSIYTLRYESVDPDGILPTEVILDPEDGVDGGYIDDGETTLAKDPTNYDREKWIWEGWQVVDVHNNVPLTNIRSPGDLYIVHAAHADYIDNVIHFRAVYSRRDDGTSRHIPEVVDLILDSNDDAALAPGGAVQTQAGRIGTYSAGSFEGLNEGVWFAGQQNNFSVKLADYTSAFRHDDGFLLLGWDTNRVSETGIPAYYANETIGIDKSASQENILYAVWEPQIYIMLTNATSEALHNVTLDIPEWYQGNVFKVPSLADAYHRERFEAFQDGTAVFDLAAGEGIILVVPDGKHKVFTVTGANPFPEGTKLTVRRIAPHVDGEAHDEDYSNTVYAGENYLVTGTMHVSAEPVRVEFTQATYPTSKDVPVRYFLHELDGSVNEITHDASAWKSTAYKTNLTVTAAMTDLALELRQSVNVAVHGFLSDALQASYGHTTIGIGSASATVTGENFGECEFRTITKRATSGGSFLRFVHENLEWSRYSVVWNGYDDAAVYVVFYHRIPVHVTVAKNVAGSDEDMASDRKVKFTADFTEKSDTYEFTVSTRKQRTRTVTETRRFLGSWSVSGTTAWSTDATVGNPATNAYTLVSSDQYLFSPSRDSETFSLAHGERHPITVYFNPLRGQDASRVTMTGGASTFGDYDNDAWWDTTRSRTETTNYTENVTYLLTYQYETVTIREAAEDLYNLVSIDGGSDSHSGTHDISGRSYTVSSKTDTGTYGVSTYTPLDTAIFTNRRKTGSLTVSKTVEGLDEGDSFAFSVTLGESVVDHANYGVPGGVHLGPWGRVFSFSLKGGEQLTLTNLPVGASCTVAEVEHANYIATVPANASGTVAEGTTAVPFVNTRKTQLAIAMNCQTNYFNGAEQVGSEIHQVMGTGSDVVTSAYKVTGLKAGHVLTVEHHVPARGTAVGEYTGHFENARFTVHDANGEDVTREYLFSTQVATLTILASPITVTVTGRHSTVQYDGEEHMFEGYDYTVTHSKTGATFDSDSIYVAIDPQLQTAWGTDVGEYPMSITADRVVVTVPDGYIVSDVVVAENGSLTITPAPVVVAADDKTKIFGLPDPALTATVTGLFGSDTVAYTLSREPGETAGAYQIATAGDALQGNYSVSYAPGTFTIGKLMLVQRATGEGLSAEMPVTAALIEALGLGTGGDISPEAVEAALNATDPNGLRRWENLVTGTPPDQLLLSTSVDVSNDSIAFGLDGDAGEVTDLGYTVLRELRRYSSGVWSRAAEPSAVAPPIFSVSATGGGNSQSVSGYYRIVTLLVPNHELSITNEIPSTNVVGVLEVASGLKNTMTAVPWTALARDPAKPQSIKVADFIAATQLAAGDSILALNANGIYEKWTLKEPTRGSARAWAAAATVSSSSDGDSVGVLSVPPAAGERGLERSNAVWVTREGSDRKPYFLVGQYSGESVDVAILGADGDRKGCTLVPNPNLSDLAINSVDWGSNPGADDVITIPDIGNLRWDSAGKVWWRTCQTRDPATRKPVKIRKTDDVIPAGRGFWYYRFSPGSFGVSIPVEKVED